MCLKEHYIYNFPKRENTFLYSKLQHGKEKIFYVKRVINQLETNPSTLEWNMKLVRRKVWKTNQETSSKKDFSWLRTSATYSKKYVASFISDHFHA